VEYTTSSVERKHVSQSLRQYATFMVEQKTQGMSVTSHYYHSYVSSHENSF